MSVSLTVNGVTYAYPEVDDVDWGSEATGWAEAVTSGMLQKAGGTFQLLAEVDFGTSYGLKSLYYKTRTASPADAGQIRFAKTDVLSWRNNAGDGNLDLSIDASDNLQFNGSDIQGVVSVSDTATIDLTFISNVLQADIKTDCITNAMINSAAAIAYSKLNLTGSIVNADVNASAAIAYSKLVLTGSIVNADVNASAAIAYSKLNLATSIVNADINAAAAIAYSKLNLTGDIVNADINASAAVALTKLAAMTISRAVVSDGSGFLVPATTTATEIGYVNGVTSAIQTQLNAKQATGNYITALTGNVTASGPGSVAATIANDVITNVMVNSAAAIAYSKLALSGSIVNADVNASAAIAYSKLALSGSIVNADVNASAAIAYSKLALTGSIVNADVSASAAIAYSKLAALTSAHILVGNGSNVATDVAVTGDISLSNAGATAYSGTVPVNKGGTGQTSYTDGQLLIGNSSGSTLSKATLSAGSNITITNGNGTISIAAAGSAPSWSYVSQSSTLNPAALGSYYVLSGASFTITLPTAASVAGQSMAFQHSGTSLSQVYTFNTTSAQTIGGIASGSYALYTNGEVLLLVSDGANWLIEEHHARTGVISAGTITVGATTTPPTKGGITRDALSWSRDGRFATINYNYAQTGGSPAAGTGDYLFGIPSNMTIDTAVIPVYTTGTNANLGNITLALGSIIPTTGFMNTATTAGTMSISAYCYSTTQVRMAGWFNSSGSISGGGNGSGFITFGSAALTFNFTITVPISGWQP